MLHVSRSSGQARMHITVQPGPSVRPRKAKVWGSTPKCAPASVLCGDPAVPIRYPAPLQPGHTIGITAPSSGVPKDLQARLEFCLSHLRERGYEVVVGACMDGAGIVSASAAARAEELTGMLTNPSIRAVVPPWGGELAIEVLPRLDLQAVASADPTWLVGYSDTSTLLLPVTTVAGIATLHGQNLLDTPYHVPKPLLPWLDVVTQEAGSSFVQGPSTCHRAGGFDDWHGNPTITDYTLDTVGTWSLLDPGVGAVDASGRLIGGCIETVSVLAGTPFGDLRAFARDHAPEGLILYLEASDNAALTIARDLWRLRLAGWFEPVNAVLVGRTAAPAENGFSQVDAVRSATGDLDVPVVLDVDCGHLPPHLALVNGALTELVIDGTRATLTQRLV